MFTAKAPLAAINERPEPRRRRHTSTSGGSRETEVNEFAVTPYRPAGPPVVTTVTPVAKAPSARRNWVESKGGSSCTDVIGGSPAKGDVAGNGEINRPG